MGYNRLLIFLLISSLVVKIIAILESVPPDPDCYMDMKEIVIARGYHIGIFLYKCDYINFLLYYTTISFLTLLLNH